MNRANAGLQDSYRTAAAALLAVFCAHIFAVQIAGPASDTSPASKRRRVAAGQAVALGAAPTNGTRPKRAAAQGDPLPIRRAAPRPAGKVELAAYKGLGTWIDLFDHGPWRNPTWTVRRAAQRGARTIFLQTSTYGSPRPIMHVRKVAEFITAAHRRGLRVVGWSVPAFTTPKKDLYRARAAVNFRTHNGEGFDSFGLDIEANIVDNIGKRNARLMWMSEKLRQTVGPDYPLAAIVPDSHSRYWPNFPYKRIARVYDVMVPMGYFTFSTSGYRSVRTYTTNNIRTLRRETGKVEIPIHVIGGIADDVGVPAARGFVRAVKEQKILGASLYDFAITGAETWRELKPVVSGVRRAARKAGD
ncbi:MAG TPA: hypothetical protein VG106_09250 [Vicinamibacterales bacterium]|nr:hypothetical protein [Vicinamibacterales bacterium]